MTDVHVALFNYQAGGYHEGTFNMQPLRQVFAALDARPAIILFCLTDPAARFWSVTRDFTKFTCARRGRSKGAPQFTRPRERGEFDRSWIRRRAA